MTTEGLTKLEEKTLIELVGKLGSKWSAELYNAMAPKFALTAVETVFLVADIRMYVLLHRRPITDIPQWVGRPASPGSMLRASDTPGSYKDAIARVQRELKGADFSITPKSVDSIFQHTDRGPENGLVFVCVLKNPMPPAVPEGFWWQDVKQLPPDLLSHHPALIQAACDHLFDNKIPVAEYLKR